MSQESPAHGIDKKRLHHFYWSLSPADREALDSRVDAWVSEEFGDHHPEDDDPFCWDREAKRDEFLEALYLERGPQAAQVAPSPPAPAPKPSLAPPARVAATGAPRAAAFVHEKIPGAIFSEDERDAELREIYEGLSEDRRAAVDELAARAAREQVGPAATRARHYMAELSCRRRILAGAPCAPHPLDEAAQRSDWRLRSQKTEGLRHILGLVRHGTIGLPPSVKGAGPSAEVLASVAEDALTAFAARLDGGELDSLYESAVNATADFTSDVDAVRHRGRASVVCNTLAWLNRYETFWHSPRSCALDAFAKAFVLAVIGTTDQAANAAHWSMRQPPDSWRHTRWIESLLRHCAGDATLSDAIKRLVIQGEQSSETIGAFAVAAHSYMERGDERQRDQDMLDERERRFLASRSLEEAAKWTECLGPPEPDEASGEGATAVSLTVVAAPAPRATAEAPAVPEESGTPKAPGGPPRKNDAPKTPHGCRVRPRHSQFAEDLRKHRGRFRKIPTMLLKNGRGHADGPKHFVFPRVQAALEQHGLKAVHASIAGIDVSDEDEPARCYVAVALSWREGDALA